MAYESPLNRSMERHQDGGPTITDLGVKATTDALSLFGGWYFYFVEAVNRYLELTPVKDFFFVASIWMLATNLFFNIYKQQKNCTLKIRYNYLIKMPIALAITWMFLSIIALYYGLCVYQTLDSLDMKPWRFFNVFIKFMLFSYIVSIIFKHIFDYIKEKYFEAGTITNKN